MFNYQSGRLNNVEMKQFCYSDYLIKLCLLMEVFVNDFPLALMTQMSTLFVGYNQEGFRGYFKLFTINLTRIVRVKSHSGLHEFEFSPEGFPGRRHET